MMNLYTVLIALLYSTLISSLSLAAFDDEIGYPIDESRRWFQEITTFLNDPETDSELLQKKADSLVDVFFSSETVKDYINNVSRKRLSNVSHAVGDNIIEYLGAPNISAPILESDERLILKMELLEISIHAKNKWTRLNHLEKDAKIAGITALVSGLAFNLVISPFGGWVSGNGFAHSFLTGFADPTVWLGGIAMGAAMAALLRASKNLTEENSFRGNLTSRIKHWHKYYSKPYMCRRFYRL